MRYGLQEPKKNNPVLGWSGSRSLTALLFACSIYPCMHFPYSTALDASWHKSFNP